MDQIKKLKRKARIRKKIFGTMTFPRMTVSKSLKGLSVQVINDDISKTLCSGRVNKKNVAGAEELAKIISNMLKEKKIDKIKFDRNGYVYHGVIKALVEGIRSNSIQV